MTYPDATAAEYARSIASLAVQLQDFIDKQDADEVWEIFDLIEGDLFRLRDKLCEPASWKKTA